MGAPPPRANLQILPPSDREWPKPDAQALRGRMKAPDPWWSPGYLLQPHRKHTYRAFYNIIRLSEEVASQDARKVELANVYSNIFPMMKEDREFFGLIKEGFERFEFQAW